MTPVAPRVILTTNGQTHRQAVMEKEDVYLHCEVRANPQVVTVQWLYEGVPIVNNLSQGVIITNQSLVLSKAQRFHRGKYQCLASNIEGQGKSEELFLEINYAPKCRNGQDNLYGAGKDELVRVKCEVEAEPPDVEFHWNFNNTVEKRDLSSFTVDGLQSVVTYIPRKLDDYGTLSCWSRNIAGQQEEPCLFTIILVGPPEKVRNCTVTNITSSSLLIECESGHDGGLQQRFHLEVYNSAKERLEANLTNSINPVFHVTSLPSSTSFVLIFYASNLKGRSDSFTLRAKTLVTYTKQSESFTSLPINPILGVLIGIVAALVFVAGIAVIIMKRRSDDDDKGPLEDSAVEKSQTLLRKDQKDGMESDSKDPDVIPPKSEIADYPSDEEEWQSLQSNNLSGPVYRKPIRDNYGFYEKGIGTNLQKTVKAAKNMRCNDTTAQESLISTSKQPDTQIEFSQWDLQRRRSSIKEQEMMADTPLVNSGITKIIPKHKMKNEHRTLSTPV